MRQERMTSFGRSLGRPEVSQAVRLAYSASIFGLDPGNGPFRHADAFSSLPPARSSERPRLLGSLHRPSADFALDRLPRHPEAAGDLPRGEAVLVEGGDGLLPAVRATFD